MALAIFYRSDEETPDEILIARDIIYPVCSPAVAQSLRTVENLSGQTFLYDTTWKMDWQSWLATALPGRPLLKSGPEYSLYSLALEECKNGAGVLIGHDALVSDEVTRGALVAPFLIHAELPARLSMRSMKPLQDGSPAKQVADFLLAQHPLSLS